LSSKEISLDMTSSRVGAEIASIVFSITVQIDSYSFPKPFRTPKIFSLSGIADPIESS